MRGGWHKRWALAVDLLMADGADLRPLPLKQRKAMLAAIGKRAEGWIAFNNGIVGEARALYRAAVDADLEGIAAKRLADAYQALFAADLSGLGKPATTSGIRP